MSSRPDWPKLTPGGRLVLAWLFMPRTVAWVVFGAQMLVVVGLGIFGGLWFEAIGVALIGGLQLAALAGFQAGMWRHREIIENVLGPDWFLDASVARQRRRREAAPNN